MKKNAIVIGSILFVAGCATEQSHHSRNYQHDPALSAQYDPAVGGSAFGVSGSAGSEHLNNTAVNDFHADSSIRGGSGEARGWAQRDFLPGEPSADPINPAVQADSSVRGGSTAGRENNWYRENDSSFNMNKTSDSGIKADSSIRGGSNQARYGNSFHSSSGQPLQNPDEDMIDQSTSFDYYVPPSQGPSIASDQSVQSSPNWNPSDDLLPDGVKTEPSAVSSPEPNNDASVGGAALSESGSASSKSSLDDISVPSQDVPAEPDSSHSLSSPGSEKDLNTSSQLEKDISGESNLDDQLDSNASLPNGSTAVGGPGSTETGAASSKDCDYNSTGWDTSQSSSDLSRNNPAQGVGSAATAEIGVAHSGSAAGENTTDRGLAEQVKSILTREESGTSGITQREIARNVQVTSHGGMVILKGTVPTQKAKDMLEVRAREISGVHRVDNRLTVTPEANPSVREFNFGRDLEDSTGQIHNIAR